MRKTILIITLGLLLLLSSCDNTTASGGVSLPDWMYSTEARTEAELIAALEGSSGEGEAIVSVPSGTAIELTDTIDVSGSVKLIISENAEITSSRSIFSIASGSTMTIEGKGTLDAGNQSVIENAGALTITGGSYTTTGSVAISGSGSVTVPESSTASFAVASTGSVFSGSSDLSIKGGTYNVDNKDFIALCAVGYMPQEIADSDPARYEVGWSDAKIVADIINGLSQENVQQDLATILSSLTASGEEGGTGTGESGNDGSTQTGTASVSPRVAVAGNTLTITEETDGSFTLEFDDYTHGFKDPDFATVVSGTAVMTIALPSSGSAQASYTISCTDVTVDVDGHTVVINLESTTGDIQINTSGTSPQIQIMYPEVADNALRVRSDGGTGNTVNWSEVEDLLDAQASITPSASTGSGSAGN